MQTPVGYIINPVHAPVNCYGMYYDYLFAKNGVFIQASGQHIMGRTLVAECEIRGLEEAHPLLELKHGRIPAILLDLALGAASARSPQEVYLSIVWREGRYQLIMPEQEATPGSVKYEAIDDVVLDLHSHPRMAAIFSGTDNRDEQGLRLYGVVGRHRGSWRLSLRLGVYGYFQELEADDVFEGDLSAWHVEAADGV